MEPDFFLDWQQLVQEAVKRRKQHRFTQKELAVIAGMSRATVNAFEQGKTNITLDNALKLLYWVGLAPRPEDEDQRCTLHLTDPNEGEPDV